MTHKRLLTITYVLSIIACFFDLLYAFCIDYKNGSNLIVRTLVILLIVLCFRQVLEAIRYLVKRDVSASKLDLRFQMQDIKIFFESKEAMINLGIELIILVPFLFLTNGYLLIPHLLWVVLNSFRNYFEVVYSC